MADTVEKTKASATQTPPLGTAASGAPAENENAFTQFIRALMQMFQQGIQSISAETAINGGDEAVKKLQGELAEQGFYPKTGKFAKDGIAGDVTRHALKLRDEPGYAEEHMKTALQGDKLSKTDIMKIQASLNKLGYDAGDVNGRMNNETRDDIKRYLKDNPNVTASPKILEASEPKSGFSRFVSDIGEKLKSGKDYVFTPSAGGATGRLKDLISQHESGGNYNARYGKAGGDGTDFTNMTINEVQKWQRDFVKQGSPSSAVGRYQIIQDTLAGLKKDMGLTGNEKFDAAMQDRMADRLLEQRGLKDYMAGNISADQFAKNVSKEWASMPKDSSGKSYYAGDGLNKALTSHNSVLAAIKDIKASPTQVAAPKPAKDGVPAGQSVMPTGETMVAAADRIQLNQSFTQAGSLTGLQNPEGQTASLSANTPRVATGDTATIRPAFSNAANDPVFDAPAQAAKVDPAAQTVRVSNGAPVVAPS